MSEFDLSTIGELLSGDGVSAIGKRTRVKTADVAKVLSEGIPSMISGMMSNASTDEGADSLSAALSDHSKDNIDDIASFLKGADLKDGKKILGHVFGDEMASTVAGISKASGVSKGKATSILSIAAPLLLSLLGTQQQTQQQNSGFSLGGLLGGLLGGQSGSSALTGLGAGLLGNLLGGSGEEEEKPKEGGILDSLLNIFH